MSERLPQCHGDCGVDEPHPREIMAGGVRCVACGRRRRAAKYILADSPCDEEPVSQEWMEENGFEYRDARNPFLRISTQSGWLKMYTINCSWWIGNINLPDPETIGDVRRLLSALGVDVKPV